MNSAIRDMVVDVAELAEAEAMFQLESGAPPQVRAALGMRTARIGGGVALLMRAEGGRFWSKAVGLGFDVPVSGELLDEVIDFYQSNHARMAVLQVAPAVLPLDWARLREERGIQEGASWLKLAHDLSWIELPADAPRVTRVGPDQAARWATVLVRGFGLAETGVVDIWAATVGRPGFVAFAAWDGAKMIAAANLFRYGNTVSLCGAATLPGYRRRGAQSALLAARLADARETGCQWAFAETGAETAGAHNASLHNMRRAGFSVRYARANWHWKSRTGLAD
ncbi:MAG TPA: GNAT family N-acetyltransferase [Pseudonocardiaceae bacterium]|nr:GNAT family N-acetyltransferase [Pseudonocardiaceae bacterium]